MSAPAGAEGLSADFANHHIEGIARMAMHKPGRGYFDCPLISEVWTATALSPLGATNRAALWQGGCIDGVNLGDEFDTVLSLYTGQVYRHGPDTDRIVIPMIDGPSGIPVNIDDIVDLALAKVLAGKTLIHCQAGLNRSGLVSALVLIRLGLHPDDAIDVLRAKRSPMVLCNEAFEHYVRTGKRPGEDDDQ